MRWRIKGFTLLEMIVVLMLIGILAIAVAPRLNNINAFQARGFHDETLALLRYAQQSAISHRRTVCATFTSSSATLTIASVGGATNCDSNLVGPRGETPAAVTAKSGISYASAPSSFRFNALGQPSFSTSQTIQVSGITQVITVEAETGYVHD